MIVLGLTGSIGMGKSMAAAMLERCGVPVHAADAEVHDLLTPSREAYWAVTSSFPYFEYPQIYKKTGKYKTIDRKALGAVVFADDGKRRELESILHPYVRTAQNDFIRHCRIVGLKLVALDIPLLFETRAELSVDYTITVTAPAFVQRARVLARPGMDEKRFGAILRRQMPDGEKAARADFVLHTGLGRAHTMRQLRTILREVKQAA